MNKNTIGTIMQKLSGGGRGPGTGSRRTTGKRSKQRSGGGGLKSMARRFLR